VESQTRTAVEFAVLGPLVARVHGREIEFTGAKERSLLAFLLLNPNETVSLDRLIDALWPHDPPATARNTLQVHVSRLRKALGAGRLATASNGYSLTVRPDELDLFRFRRFCQDGRRLRSEGDAAAAAEDLRSALALWRGRPLPEFSENPVLVTEIARLEEEHLSAFEEWIEAELDLGEGPGLVAELEGAAAENPLRERMMGQLMVALYRAGRQAEALDAYGRTRRRLVEDLGLEPGPMLSDLHQRILAHDPTLIPPPRAESRPASGASRRTLTVVVVAPSISGDLDPEIGGRHLEALRHRARSAFGTHGAVVSSTADSVLGTFGLPAAREDDSLRAVQAATELADEGLRVAVDTGVALASDAELADSQFVGRLIRLIGSAEPGHVVLGAGAREILGDTVEVAGSRLVSFDPTADPIPRHFDAPLIGRELEFGRLMESFNWTVRNSSSHLVTIIGPAGIGKSRLARELAASVDQATVLTGRCLPYGAGAFWPLAEMVKQAAGDTTPDALELVLEDLEDRRLVVDQLAAALGRQRIKVDRLGVESSASPCRPLLK
jgi:DNA-binding SARP family transcriptional activator